MLEYLLRKEVFRIGYEFKCENCNLANWLSLETIDDWWNCNYCGYKNQTCINLISNSNWKLRKSGLFSKDNNQEGAIPVILTLLQLNRVLNLSDFIFSSSLNLTFDSSCSEIDFFAMTRNFQNSIEVVIGECKDERGLIDDNDVENLLKVRKKFISKEIQCYLSISKTAEKFGEEEIKLFKNLASENIPLILFTNKELEPYEPYEEYEKNELPYYYANTLEQIAENSKAIYLK